MRYVVQFLVPIALILALVYLGTRNRPSNAAQNEVARDQKMVLIILAIGAALAALLGMLLFRYLEQ